MITTSDILNSFSPERKKRIEEGAKVVIAELGLDKHSSKNREDSLKDTLLLENNAIYYYASQRFATVCHAHKVVYNQVWKAVKVDAKLAEA